MMERVQPCKQSLQKAVPFLSCIGRTPYSEMERETRNRAEVGRTPYSEMERKAYSEN